MSGSRGAPSRPAVLAVSTLAMGLGAAPMPIVGYLGAALRADLGLTGAQLGLVVGVFYGATGVTSLLGSRLVDRLGARWWVAGDQALTAAGLAGAAAVGSFPALLVASVVTGCGYAFVNAGTSVAVTSVSRRDQAAAAVAVKTAGIPGLLTVVALAGPPAAEAVGWRGVVLVLAALAAVNTALAMVWVPSHRAAPGPAGRRGAAPLPRGFAWVLLAATCFVIGTNPLSAFLVVSLVDGGVSPVTAGLVSAAGTGAGTVAMVVVARRSDRRGPLPRAATAARVCLVGLAGTLLLWAGTHLGLAVVAVGAVAGLLCAMVGAGFAHAVTVDRAPHAVGRATAVMSCGYYLGALVSPLAFGALADLTGGYDLPWAVTAAAMAVAVASYAVVQRRVPPAAVPRAAPVAAATPRA
ncbi:Nitrate/nitrite transporter NarK [Geodermatophilus dictyosporus]|uniref:Nitrate/nitrite transporter NarK n=1 Tax=Geodermatophilus dictyosporus TaxID=1523247 RepID=A0A1I5QS85_9ACTN|nr:MFS transporter [Geodermatophilus dictyosporus]SFP49083.1 Nitrate/nitrite transporter NarK [Geodermatophilus dictyosporus]